MRCGAGLRRRELSLAAMALVGSVDAEDAVIDFSSAGLYVAGIQTVFAVVSVAVVSVLACWIAPENGVSAVRTLALCSATGAALMRAPLRIGRTHGVNVVFSSLQPAIVLYLMALVVEQLIHTCSIETQTAPSWRKVVFHAMTIVMTAAGVMRARAPMSDTDLPFLATASALLVIAVLPPQSVALVGPLCQQVGGWAAAERCLRALVFSALYSVHVYSSIAASSLTRTESLVVIARSAAAAVWTMASHVALLVVAVLSGQLSVGWSNDWIDARQGRDDGRTDKPAAVGSVTQTAVRRAAMGALVVTVVTSMWLGLLPGALHLLAVAMAWAYNAALKGTAWSPVSYLVAFGLLPVVVTTTAGAGWPAWWAVVAAACFGAGVHAANVLPDLERDRAQGIGGLPQRLGSAGAAAMAVTFLGVGSASALFGAAVRGGQAVGVGAVLGMAVVATLLVGVVASHRAGRPGLAFRLSMATGLLLVGTLVAQGSGLTG